MAPGCDLMSASIYRAQVETYLMTDGPDGQPVPELVEVSYQPDHIDSVKQLVKGGARVINMSIGVILGCVPESGGSEPTCEQSRLDEYRATYGEWQRGGGSAFAAAAELSQDTVFVIAAGNEGMPAVTNLWGRYAHKYNVKNVLNVASVDENKRLAYDSNFGPEVDIAAPGGRATVNGVVDFEGGILSTIPADERGKIYGRKSGTSMAAPVVAGAAALVAELHPYWTGEQIASRLLTTASQQVTQRNTLEGQMFAYSGSIPLLDAAEAVKDGDDLEAAVAVSTGFFHSCALTDDGGVKCWGLNDSGQLGDGTTTSRLTPGDVVGLSTGVTAISNSDYRHMCALTDGGGVKCWGANDSGQLGDGTTTNRSTPVDVIGLSSGVRAISAGKGHTCAVTTQGGVKCWGYEWDLYGQDLTPQDNVGIQSGIQAVEAASSTTCVLTDGGGVKCWGVNDSGKLGDGTTTSRLTPVDVVGLSTGVTAISGGAVHMCALTEAGGVKCWGSNYSFQLGDGTTTNRLTPVDVVGLSTGVTAISVGRDHTCALMTGGGVKCWGNGGFGQLGDGTQTSRSTPVDVIGLSSGATAIDTGGYGSCAVMAGGGVKCWGDGGQRASTVPVDLVGFGGGYEPDR